MNNFRCTNIVFMKRILLFGLLFLSLNALSLNQEEWLTILKDSKIPTDKISFSNDMNTAVCLAFEETTLFRFDVYTGAFDLTTTPTLKDGQGRFRPEGMAQNLYISFSILDVSKFGGYDISIVTTNQPIYNTFNNYVRPLTRNSSNPNDIKRPNYLSKRLNQQSYLANSQAVSYKSTKTKSVVRISGSPMEVFINESTIFMFTHKNTQCHILDKSGSLLASKILEFDKPTFKSIKGLEVVQDKVNGDIYLIADTNFSFLVYQLNDKNELVFQQKIKNVWKNPNWVIKAGKIYSSDKLISSVN